MTSINTIAAKNVRPHAVKTRKHSQDRTLETHHKPLPHPQSPREMSDTGLRNGDFLHVHNTMKSRQKSGARTVGTKDETSVTPADHIETRPPSQDERPAAREVTPI